MLVLGGAPGEEEVLGRKRGGLSVRAGPPQLERNSITRQHQQGLCRVGSDSKTHGWLHPLTPAFESSILFGADPMFPTCSAFPLQACGSWQSVECAVPQSATEASHRVQLPDAGPIHSTVVSLCLIGLEETMEP